MNIDPIAGLALIRFFEVSTETNKAARGECLAAWLYMVSPITNIGTAFRRSKPLSGSQYHTYSNRLVTFKSTNPDSIVRDSIGA